MFNTWMHDPEAFQSEYEEYQDLMRELVEENEVDEDEYGNPSFFAVYGRKPVPGQDFDPDPAMCQDDYEFYTGTGRYTDYPDPNSPINQYDPREDYEPDDGFYFEMDGPEF
jgi:hypothetical protein